MVAGNLSCCRHAHLRESEPSSWTPHYVIVPTNSSFNSPKSLSKWSEFYYFMGRWKRRFLHTLHSKTQWSFLSETSVLPWKLTSGHQEPAGCLFLVQQRLPSLDGPSFPSPLRLPFGSFRVSLCLPRTSPHGVLIEQLPLQSWILIPSSYSLVKTSLQGSPTLLIKCGGAF